MNRWILVLLIAVGGILYLSLKSHILESEVPREKLDDIINTDFQEVRPLISPDGNRLYFSRRNHPENTGGSKDFQDIWVSDFKNGSWSTPFRLDEPINNKKANTLCSITSDGSYALLLDSYKRVKTPLAQAKDSPAGWGAPDDLIIQDFINKSSYYDFYFHQQSEVILSAIDDGRGTGKQDLYVSFKNQDGTYTRPKNLGKTINTDKADFAPFLAADGKTLYYSSFGHPGKGGSDFFVSYRLDDSWQRWTAPKNLGDGINSGNNENYLSVTADFSYVYFESYPEGAEDKDIYRAPLPRQFHPENLAPKEVTGPMVTKSAPATSRNRQTQTNIEAKEEVPQVGEAERFIGDLEARQYFRDGQINTRILNNSYFQYNSYSITPECRAKLNEISRLLLDNPVMRVQLEGHADSWGTDEANLRLSYLRAQAAAHFLIDQGISGNRLLVIGTGSQVPLASNDDEKEGRELNRRVEVTLMSPAGASDF